MLSISSELTTRRRYELEHKPLVVCVLATNLRSANSGGGGGGGQVRKLKKRLDLLPARLHTYKQRRHRRAAEKAGSLTMHELAHCSREMARAARPRKDAVGVRHLTPRAAQPWRARSTTRRRASSISGFFFFFARTQKTSAIRMQTARLARTDRSKLIR